MNLFIVIGLALAVLLLYVLREGWKLQRHKKSKLALAKAYDRLVREHKLSIEQAEMMGRKVIALDRKNKKLLLIDYSEDLRQEACIFLPAIESCRILKLGESPGTCIQKIVLELKYKALDKPESFCFYDEALNNATELTSLSRRAMHWRDRIDSCRRMESLRPAS